MGERIDAFLKDVQELEGVPASAIRDGVSYLAIYVQFKTAVPECRAYLGTNLVRPIGQME